ncbi:MAG: cupin domain-containing protein [Thermomicrobiales bacterium]
MAGPTDVVVGGDAAIAPHYGPIHVVHADALATDAAQVAGMTRYEAIGGGTVGTRALRLGRVVAHAGMISAVHHHGDCETAVYLMSGRVLMLFGPDLRERIELVPGDFFFVPPWTIHAEANLSGEDAAFIVAQSSPQGVAVNLPDIPLPNLRGSQ